MSNKSKYISTRNVSGKEIIQVLKDSEINETEVNIEAKRLFKSPSVDKDYIDSKYAEGENPNECYENLTNPSYKFYDWRNYGGDKDTDIEIYFKNILNSEGFNYLDFSNDNSIPFIQLFADPNYIASKIASSSTIGETFNTTSNYINKLLNTKIGCDYKSIPVPNANFDVEVYPFHGFDYDSELSLYYEGDNKINNPIKYISHIPGTIMALSGTVAIGSAITFVVNKAAYTTLKNFILNSFTGKHSALRETINKIFPELDKAIFNSGGDTATVNATCGTVVAEAAVAFMFLIGCLAVTEYILRIVSPDTFINNTINEGYKLYNITTGGVYNSFDILRSGVTIALGKKTDITNRAISGTTEDIKIASQNHNIYDESFFKGNVETNIINTLSNSNIVNTINNIVELDNGINYSNNLTIIDNKLIKNNNNESNIFIVNNNYLKLHKQGLYFITFEVYNEDGIGTININNSSEGSIKNIISEPANNNTSGIYKLYVNIIDIFNFNILLDSPFKGEIRNISMFNVANEYPYNEFDINGNIKNTNYLNFKLDPKGERYDTIIPPPATSYLVKLVAKEGCKLSTTKSTSFIATCMPDYGNYMDFDVTPTELYYNSSVLFKNAKHCDFIVARDEKADTILGFMPVLRNFYINTNGNLGISPSRLFNHFVDYKGSDITGISKQLLAYEGSIKDKEEYTLFFAGEADNRAQQQIFNKYFINRDSEIPFVKSLITKYWNIVGSWYIANGSAISNGYGILSQDLPNLEPSMNYSAIHWIRVHIPTHNGGNLYIDLTHTFYEAIYDIWSAEMKHPEDFPYTENGTLRDKPEGIIISNNRCYFTTSGYYDIGLRTKKGTINKSIRIISEIGFSGSISYFHLRRLSYKKDLNDRVIPLFSKKIRFRDAFKQQGLYIYVYNPSNNSYNINIEIGKINANPINNIIIGSNYISKGKLIVDTGFGTPITYSGLTNTTININIDISTFTGGSNNVRIIKFIPSSPTDYIGFIKINSPYVIGFSTNDIGLQDIELDLSDCNIGFIDNTIKSYFGNAYNNNEEFSNYMLALLINAKSIKLYNNKYLKADSKILSTVLDYLDIHNTKIYGDLKHFNDVINYLDVSNTNINTYTGHPFLQSIITKWFNTIDLPIDTYSLYNLVRSCYESTIENGELYIANNNATINNEEILGYICYLINNNNWVIQFNRANILPIIKNYDSFNAIHGEDNILFNIYNITYYGGLNNISNIGFNIFNEELGVNINYEEDYNIETICYKNVLLIQKYINSDWLNENLSIFDIDYNIRFYLKNNNGITYSNPIIVNIPTYTIYTEPLFRNINNFSYNIIDNILNIDFEAEVYGGDNGVDSLTIIFKNIDDNDNNYNIGFGHFYITSNYVSISDSLPINIYFNDNTSFRDYINSYDNKLFNIYIIGNNLNGQSIEYYCGQINAEFEQSNPILIVDGRSYESFKIEYSDKNIIINGYINIEPLKSENVDIYKYPNNDINNKELYGLLYKKNNIPNIPLNWNLLPKSLYSNPDIITILRSNFQYGKAGWYLYNSQHFNTYWCILPSDPINESMPIQDLIMVIGDNNFGMIGYSNTDPNYYGYSSIYVFKGYLSINNQIIYNT